MDKVRIKQATREGFIDCAVGGVADLSYPGSKTRRGRVQGGLDLPHHHRDRNRHMPDRKD